MVRKLKQELELITLYDRQLYKNRISEYHQKKRVFND